RAFHVTGVQTCALPISGCPPDFARYPAVERHIHDHVLFDHLLDQWSEPLRVHIEEELRSFARAAFRERFPFADQLRPQEGWQMRSEERRGGQERGHTRG